MNKNSLILCDTNICIFRTLALITPPIHEEHLGKALNMIAILTNTNLKCSIIISDIVREELSNNQILFKSVNEYCINKLHWKPHSGKIYGLSTLTGKSINKFLDKYAIDKDVLERIKNYSAHLLDVKKFYLKYPERLKKLTSKKIKNLSRRGDIQNKLAQRPHDLPEQNDLLLLCQAIELNSIADEDVGIFSDDGDFIEFKDEILKEFDIKIICINDDI